MTQHDSRQRYCRMLGHSVPFRYCRSVSEALPCSKVLDCWFEMLPVQEFIENHYTEEERGRIFSPPKSRMETLEEIVNRIRKGSDQPQDKQP